MPPFTPIPSRPGDRAARPRQSSFSTDTPISLYKTLSRRSSASSLRQPDGRRAFMSAARSTPTIPMGQTPHLIVLRPVMDKDTQLVKESFIESGGIPCFHLDGSGHKVEGHGRGDLVNAAAPGVQEELVRLGLDRLSSNTSIIRLYDSIKPYETYQSLDVIPRHITALYDGTIQQGTGAPRRVGPHPSSHQSRCSQVHARIRKEDDSNHEFKRLYQSGRRRFIVDETRLSILPCIPCFLHVQIGAKDDNTDDPRPERTWPSAHPSISIMLIRGEIISDQYLDVGGSSSCPLNVTPGLPKDSTVTNHTCKDSRVWRESSTLGESTEHLDDCMMTVGIKVNTCKKGESNIIWCLQMVQPSTKGNFHLVDSYIICEAEQPHPKSNSEASLWPATSIVTTISLDPFQAVCNAFTAASSDSTTAGNVVDLKTVRAKLNGRPEWLKCLAVHTLSHHFRQPLVGAPPLHLTWVSILDPCHSEHRVGWNLWALASGQRFVGEV